MNASPDNGTKGIGVHMPMLDGGIEAKAAGQRAAKSGSTRARNRTPLVFEKLCIQRHAPWLYREMMDPSNRYLILPNVHINTEVDFEAWLLSQCRSNYLEFYVVHASDTGKPVGFVYAYDYRPDDGHCRICVHIAHGYRSTGAGALAAAHFIGLLFRSYPLRKVYSAVYGFNTASLQGNMKAGFVEEARLPEYRYYEGKYWDLVLCSMSREAYQGRLARYDERFFPRA